jgi:hypothetical protein
MNLPSGAQVAAFGRHVATFAAGGATLLATMNIVSAGDATTIAHSVDQISAGVAQIAAGVAPLVAIGSGLWAAWTASQRKQIQAVNSADNGLKVVPESSPGPKMSAPLK